MAGNNEEFMVRFDLDVSAAISNANKLSQSLGNVVGALGQVGAATQKMQGGQAGAAAAATKTATAAKSAGGAITTLNGKTYENAAALQAASKQTATYNQYMYDQERAQHRLIQNLSTTRYALYDVSRTLGIVGVALLALPAATVGVAIAFERDFANVRRTAQVSGAAAADLRKSLIDLSTTIPASFADITQIAALGGQLGIASGDLKEFTSVVARLAATTDLSAEAAGTMLGRFQALLGVKGDQFEALASSILKVGINSVATETQIVNIATQISSMGAFAGLTADQVIGLSGALASVGTAPELSRGTITRVFSNMSKAIAAGGADLERFANIAGVSSSEFKSSFGTAKFAGVFQKFLQGLNGVTESGGNAVTTLNAVGITSVRDVPLLLRLAKAGDVVTSSFSDASTGFSAATELQKQYGIVAQTTAARIQVLVNAVQKFLDSIGSSATGPLNEFIQLLTGAISGLADFLSTDTGQRFAIIAVVVTTLFGALALLGAVAAATAAGGIAMRQAYAGLGAVFGSAAAEGGILSRSLTGVGVSAATATTAAKGLGVALKAISLVGLALLLPDILNGISNISNGIQGIDTSNIDDAIKRVKGDFFTQANFQANNPELARGLLDTTGIAAYTVVRETKAIDQAISGLIAGGKLDEAKKKIADFQKAAGIKDNKEALRWLPDTAKALTDVSAAGSAATDSMNALDKAQADAEESTQRLASAIGLLPDELQSLQDAVKSGSSEFFNFGDMIQKAYAEGGGGLQGFANSLGKSITEQGKWADNLQNLAARGATGLVTQLAKMGPEGAAAAADAVKLTTDQLNKLEDNARLAGFLASDGFAQSFTQNIPGLTLAFQQGGIEAVQGLIAAQRQEAQSGIPGAVQAFVDKWNATYANRPISMPVDANTSAADIALRNLFARWNGATINLRATTDARLGSGILGSVGRASGGPIYGPGTATSDSIPARLSHGEYVIRAASVRKYGMGMFDSLNRGVARFASGGPVYRGASQPMSIGRQDAGVNVSIVQNNPVTRDPLKQLRETSENLAAGIWSR